VYESPGPVDLQSGDVEVGIGGCRYHGHEVPVLRGGDFLSGLSCRPSCRHEEHAIQVELDERFFRRHEVSEVDGIESPAHDAEARRCSHSRI
jgi:hypothetical protein